MKLFNGRINRLSYWMGNMLLTIFAVTVVYGLPFIYQLIFQSKIPDLGSRTFIIFTAGILMFYESSFSIRRAHDLGEGWNMLTRYGIRDFINGLKLTYKRGDKTDNEFGSIPQNGIDLKSLLFGKTE